MKSIDEKYIESARRHINKLSPLSIFLLRGESGEVLLVDSSYSTSNITAMAQKYGRQVRVAVSLAIYGAKTEHPWTEKMKSVTIIDEEDDPGMNRLERLL